MGDTDASTTNPAASAWEPLEGTPGVFNVLAKNLGLDTRRWHFVDILGLDDDMLALTIPLVTTNGSSSNNMQHQLSSEETKNYSAVALIMLYPTTDNDIQAYLAKGSQDETGQLGVSQEKTSTANKDSHSECFFLKQIVGGTCGTIAVVHAIANTIQCHEAIALDSILSSMVNAWNDSGKLANSNDDILKLSRCFVTSAAVRQAHEQAAASSSINSKRSSTTSFIGIGQRQGRHFITLVHRNGTLWEVDGRRDTPTRLGTTGERSFLTDAMARVKGILAATKDTSIHARCSLVALVPILDD